MNTDLSDHAALTQWQTNVSGAIRELSANPEVYGFCGTSRGSPCFVLPAVFLFSARKRAFGTQRIPKEVSSLPEGRALPTIKKLTAFFIRIASCS